MPIGGPDRTPIDSLSLLERFLARADRLGEPVLIEFRRLRLPPAGRDVFEGDAKVAPTGDAKAGRMSWF